MSENHTDLVARLRGQCWQYDGYLHTAADLIESQAKEIERLKASGLTLGVGDGDGKLFVHGDYDSIKAAQAYILRVGEQAKEIERLKEALGEK